MKCLSDSTEEVMWQWSPPEPLQPTVLLVPHQIPCRDLLLNVPTEGKDTLALLVDGDEFAQQGLWFGPRGANREGMERRRLTLTLRPTAAPWVGSESFGQRRAAADR